MCMYAIDAGSPRTTIGGDGSTEAAIGFYVTNRRQPLPRTYIRASSLEVLCPAAPHSQIANIHHHVQGEPMKFR